MPSTPPSSPPAAPPSISGRQLSLLALLTVVWGLNWPIMKLGVTGYPPLTFRTLSMWLGLPVLGLALVFMRVPFAVPRRHWRALLLLTATNMLAWHTLAILALPQLPSGRAAILGYTMPIFAALIGAFAFGDRLRPRAWGGVLAAAIGVALLLWNEMTQLTGSPAAVLMMLAAAAIWALGTHLLRRTSIPVPTLAISFWMTFLAAGVLAVLALVFERGDWRLPGPTASASILYNAVMIFGFAHAAWFTLARGLPPVASSLSVMLIPVLGVFSGALALGEVLRWQDWTAVVLMVVAIASVLLPARPRAGAP